MTSLALTRRDALMAFAAATCAACLPGGPSRAPGLLALTDGLDLSAAAAAFQAAYPKDSRVEAIVAALPDPKGKTKADLRDAVSKLATDDYAAGRTVVAHGWVMSKTEAALATLAHYDALIHG